MAISIFINFPLNILGRAEMIIGQIDLELKQWLDTLSDCFNYWVLIGNYEQAIETARRKAELVDRI